MFDSLNIAPANKFYRMDLSENGKFMLNEISANEAGKKVSKIINKKTLIVKDHKLILMASVFRKGVIMMETVTLAKIA